MTEEKVYLRILEDGAVVYPLTEAHVQTSGEPLELFKEVHFAPKPQLKPFEEARENLTVYSDGFGRVDYIVQEIPINVFLNRLQPRNPETEEVKLVPYSEIDINLAYWAFDKIAEQVQSWLDQFAQSKDYSSIESAVSYISSSREERSTEARRAADLRDETWDKYYQYKMSVQSGTEPFPCCLDDVKKHLPELTW